MNDPVLRAWAYLSRVAEAPCAPLAELVRRVGPVEAADRVRRGVVDAELARHTEARREIDRAAADLELIAGRGDEALARGERAWWSHNFEPPIPLAIAPGDALYVISDISGWDSDFVVTVYR